MKHWFLFSVLFLLLLAGFLRFYNYQNRWGLSYDQARDVIVAREALQSHRVPAIGPFSSAGQFVYGPQWYWILMLFVAVIPQWILSAWVMQTVFYVGMVGLMVAIGSLLRGKHFGLLLGLLTAVSPAQISQSINLTSPSMVGFIAMLAVYLFIRFIKTPSPVGALLLGIAIGTAINVHFQAFGLLFLIPIASLTLKKKRKFFLLILAGLAIPFIPLILFDFRTNFFESKNFLDYYLYGQHKIYVPNRWLTYAGVFWPNAWAKIIGGYSLISIPIIAALGLSLVVSVAKRAASKVILMVAAAFLCSFVMLRYFKGSLYDGYLVFLHPYVFILTGWTVVSVFQWKKWLGVMMAGALVIGSLSVVIPEIAHAKNDTAMRAQHWMNLLIETYPEEKFLMFDYLYRNTSFSLPLVLFMEYRQKLDDHGYKIGFGNSNAREKLWHEEIKGNQMGYEILTLESSSSAALKEYLWADVNPSMVYHSTVEWYKDRTF